MLLLLVSSFVCSFVRSFLRSFVSQLVRQLVSQLVSLFVCLFVCLFFSLLVLSLLIKFLIKCFFLLLIRYIDKAPLLKFFIRFFITNTCVWSSFLSSLGYYCRVQFITFIKHFCNFLKVSKSFLNFTINVASDLWLLSVKPVN